MQGKKTIPSMTPRYYEEARLELTQELEQAKRLLERKVDVYSEMKAIYDNRHHLGDLTSLLTRRVTHEMMLGTGDDTPWWNLYRRGNKAVDIRGLELGMSHLSKRILLLKQSVSQATYDLHRWEKAFHKQ